VTRAEVRATQERVAPIVAASTVAAGTVAASAASVAPGASSMQPDASEPSPSQPAEAAAAPAQAAAHDAAFAAAPSEHDVERTPSAMESNVESAAQREDEAVAIAPGMWDATPVANDAVDTPRDMAVESPAAQAASFASGDIEAGTPPAIDAMSRNAETDVQAIADNTAAPVSPGLFDALPPEDPAQAAAEAAAEAGEAEAADADAGEVAQAPRQDAAQQDASHNA